jgi:2-polyprenyl-3-methyl-5-hydroxy-6-metoxy-1,4-benzoquinol methylase
MQGNSLPPHPRWGSENRSLKAEAIWQTLLHYCGSDIAHGRWVDIGCGSGGIAAQLAPKVGEIIGIDPEPWACWTDWTRDHANLTFLCGSYDNETAVITQESTDVVICNQVYEHVPDPASLIRFIHGILKPGGYCYFAGPNLLFPIEPHVYWPFVHWLPRSMATQLMRTLGSGHADELDAYSTHFWKLKSWIIPYFKFTNAVPFVVNNIVQMQHSGALWRTLRYLPAPILDAFTPFSPGFVFVIKKNA